MMGLSTNRMIVATALLGMGLTISACGKSSTDTVGNSQVTEMNAMDTMEGTTNDTAAMDTPTDMNMTIDNMAAAGDNMSGGNMADGNSAAGNAM